MSHVFADNVKETSTTTGTGTYDLDGPVSGSRTAVAGVATGNSSSFFITDGIGNWEVIKGTVTDASPDTLSRDSIEESSNGGSAVSWADSSTKLVFAVVSGADLTAMLTGASAFFSTSGGNDNVSKSNGSGLHTMTSLAVLSDQTIKGSNTTASQGSEKVTNGAFTTDLTGWTSGGNWAQSSGTALHTAGSAATLSQNVSVAPGDLCLVSYDVVGLTAGDITVSLGGVTGPTISADGTGYEVLIEATSTADLAFTPASAFDGATDNVTVTQITPSDPLEILYNDDDGISCEIRGSTGGAEENIYIGSNSGRVSLTAVRNVCVGENAGESITDAQANILLGYLAGSMITTGDQNFALGTQSLLSLTTGRRNVAIGNAAMIFLETGEANVAIGRNAGRSVLGDGGIYIGSQAGQNETGSDKLYIANSTTATPLIHGDFSSSTLTFYADVVAAPLTDKLALTVNRPTATTTDSVAEFASDVGGADTVTCVVQANGDLKNINGVYGTISDEKFKNSIRDAGTQLQSILDITIRVYGLKDLPGSKLIGVIAQELELICPALVYETDDYEDIPDSSWRPRSKRSKKVKDDKGKDEIITIPAQTERDRPKKRVKTGTATKSVKMSVFLPMLIKAFQEEHAIVSGRLDAIEARLDAIEGDS